MDSNYEHLKTILYNAISLLIDETFEQYDDTEEWFSMIQNELGCSAEELERLCGITITVNGGLESSTKNSFTAFVYEDGGVIPTDFTTYNTKEKAIDFAQKHQWDEVVDDITGDVIWRGVYETF